MAALSLGIGAGLVLARALTDSGRAVEAVRQALDRTEAEVPEQIETWQEAVERVA